MTACYLDSLLYAAGRLLRSHYTTSLHVILEGDLFTAYTTFIIIDAANYPQAYPRLQPQIFSLSKS